MEKIIEITPATTGANPQESPAPEPVLQSLNTGDVANPSSNSTRKYNVTPAVISSRRQNAKKSTGPRTAQGKAKAKMNAVKHGLFAEIAVIRAHKFHESKQDFEQLCREFNQSLAPVGPVEEALVNRIIMAIWRQRRLHIAENGEIAKAINDAQSPDPPDHREALHLLAQNNPGLPAMPETLLSCRELCKSLQILKESVGRNYIVEPGEVEKYYKAVGRRYYKLLDGLMDFQSKFAEDPKSRELGGPKVIAETLRQGLLKRLRAIITDAESRLKNLVDLKSAEDQAERSAALLPSSEALDKILRCEGSLERQLYRALNQLERLQRMRQGETVPPPISVIT